MQQVEHFLPGLYLQRVGSYFVGEAYASSLLLEVDDDAVSMLLYVFHRKF